MLPSFIIDFEENLLDLVFKVEPSKKYGDLLLNETTEYGTSKLVFTDTSSLLKYSLSTKSLSENFILEVVMSVDGDRIPDKPLVTFSFENSETEVVLFYNDFIGLKNDSWSEKVINEDGSVSYTSPIKGKKYSSTLGTRLNIIVQKYGSKFTFFINGFLFYETDAELTVTNSYLTLSNGLFSLYEIVSYTSIQEFECFNIRSSKYSNHDKFLFQKLGTYYTIKEGVPEQLSSIDFSKGLFDFELTSLNYETLNFFTEGSLLSKPFGTTFNSPEIVDFILISSDTFTSVPISNMSGINGIEPIGSVNKMAISFDNINWIVPDLPKPLTREMDSYESDFYSLSSSSEIEGFESFKAFSFSQGDSSNAWKLVNGSSLTLEYGSELHLMQLRLSISPILNTSILIKQIEVQISTDGIYFEYCGNMSLLEALKVKQISTLCINKKASFIRLVFTTSGETMISSLVLENVGSFKICDKNRAAEFLVRNEYINIFNTSLTNEVLAELFNKKQLHFFLIASKDDTLENIKFSFPENTAPVIFNTDVSFGKVHAEDVTFSAEVRDIEEDKLYYSYFLKTPEDTEYIQLYPDEGMAGLASNNIECTLNHPTIKLGKNNFLLKVMDEKGLITEWETSVDVIDTEPYLISVSNTAFEVNYLIDDKESDFVAFKLAIKKYGSAKFEQVLPESGYSEFKKTPFSLRYEIDSKKIVFGKNNTVRIYLLDNFGMESYFDVNIIGQYRNLLFSDTAGNYYSDDFGNMLKLLDMGLIVSGTEPLVYKVFLENSTPKTLNNVKVSVPLIEVAPKAYLEISETEDPFYPKQQILFRDNMKSLDKKEFFVRVRTDVEASAGASWKILASGNILG